MASIFTRIIAGELPGRFVWKDERVVAILSIAPLRPGHVLVIPRQESEHWIELPAELRDRLFAVAQEIGQALQEAFTPVRVGMTLIGLEVPHVHVHLIPISEPAHMDFKNADARPDPAALDAAAEKVRAALRRRGSKHVSS